MCISNEIQLFKVSTFGICTDKELAFTEICSAKKNKADFTSHLPPPEEALVGGVSPILSALLLPLSGFCISRTRSFSVAFNWMLQHSEGMLWPN